MSYDLDFGETSEDVARRDGWTVAASVLGTLSWVGAILEILLLLAGPFTCFITWVWLWYALIPAVSLHGLSVFAGLGALSTRRPGEPTPSSATLALTAATIG